MLAAELETDRSQAARLASAVAMRLAGWLALVLLAGEVCCGAAWFWSDMPGWHLLVGLTAAMLPYLWFICLAAQLSTTLHALSHFRLPALAAALLNVGWLAGAWWIAPSLSADKATQAYVLAGCILAAGALQAGVLLVLVAQLGFWRTEFFRTFKSDNRRPAERHACRAPLAQIVRRMGPLVVALSVTQVSTLIDSLMAWGWPARTGATIGWLPGAIAYPLSTGATAALYYAERIYQLPVGLAGSRRGHGSVSTAQPPRGAAACTWSWPAT